MAAEDEKDQVDDAGGEAGAGDSARSPDPADQVQNAREATDTGEDSGAETDAGDSAADTAGVEEVEEPAAPAPAEPDPEADLPRKERLRLQRSRRPHEPRPQRSGEERQGERRAERTRKGKLRANRREKARRESAGREVGQGTPPAVHSPNRPKVREGVVVSSRAEKTIKVRIDIARRHPVYEKIVRQTRTLHAHDERNEASEGDVVSLVETRPLSKQKRWRLEKVLERAE